MRRKELRTEKTNKHPLTAMSAKASQNPPPLPPKHCSHSVFMDLYANFLHLPVSRCGSGLDTKIQCYFLLVRYPPLKNLIRTRRQLALQQSCSKLSYPAMVKFRLKFLGVHIVIASRHNQLLLVAHRTTPNISSTFVDSRSTTTTTTSICF